MENIKPKTLDTIPTLEETKKGVELIKKLKEKEVLLGTYLQNIESKILDDKTLRKDEKDQLEQIFGQIEGFKKTITEKMNDPVVQIDERLQDLEQRLENKNLRKDEKVPLEQEFNDLETKKKMLDNKKDTRYETQPAPIVTPEPDVEEPQEPEPAPEPAPTPTKPEPIVQENTIEYTPSGLEWVRSEYAELLFKNKDAVKYGFDIIEDLTIREHIKKVSENYHQLRFAEIQKIHDNRGTIHDQLEFQKKESALLTQEIMRLENEETKRRINKATASVVHNGGLALLYTAVLGADILKRGYEKSKEYASTTIQQIKETFQAEKNGPKTLKDRLLSRFGMYKQSEEKSDVDGKKPNSQKLTAKYGKTAEQKLAQQKAFEKKLEEVTREKELDEKIKQSLEKIFEQKLDGDLLVKWKRLSEISIVAFFNPGVKLNKKLEDYPLFAKKLYEKISPIYQRDLTTNPTIKLKDYVRELVKEGELEKLWNQPSPSNS